MLILRRRAGEALLINDNIKITIMDVYEGGVRLAIEAPREVPILRSELLVAVDANRDAANEQSEPQELMKLLGGLQKGMTLPGPDGTDSSDGPEEAE